LSGNFRFRWLMPAVPFLLLSAVRLSRACSPAEPNRELFDARLDANVVQQDRVAQYRARFDRESDPVHKAKLMVHLGAAEFDQIEKQLSSGDSAGALNGLREYEGQASSCEKALDARGIDPEKHPAGYKELQISVRESLRRLDNMMVNLTGDEQPPFREIRKSLDDLNRDLIKELFPKKSGAPAGSGKSDD
jgi:hypothetical protein